MMGYDKPTTIDEIRITVIGQKWQPLTSINLPAQLEWTAAAKGNPGAPAWFARLNHEQQIRAVQEERQRPKTGNWVSTSSGFLSSRSLPTPEQLPTRARRGSTPRRTRCQSRHSINALRVRFATETPAVLPSATASYPTRGRRRHVRERRLQGRHQSSRSDAPHHWRSRSDARCEASSRTAEPETRACDGARSYAIEP